MAELLANAATLDAIGESIARFYCGESKTLISTGTDTWAICWACDNEPLSGVQVVRKGGRFRFETCTTTEPGADWLPRDHTDWQESYSILCDTVGFMDQLTVEEHDLTEHPAAKEARATLNLCIERLDLNDVDGEERPFIEDCQTAIKLLEA